MATRIGGRRPGPALPAGLDTSCGQCLLFGAIHGLADGLLLVDREGRIVHGSGSSIEAHEDAASLAPERQEGLSHRLPAQ